MIAKQNSPRLRFQEFEGKWETNKLSDWKLKVIDGDRGTNYPNGDDFSPEGYCLFMNAKNVTKNGFSFETKMFITKEKDEKLRKGKLKRNDLILTTRGSVGNIAFYDDSIKFENLRINSGMVLIRNENSKIDSRFIYSSFFTPKLNRIIDTISFGSAQPQLTVKEINLFKFNIPTLPEQQKIASFLSAVDEKILQLSRKKELLSQYKKGVMQQLFSGKLRFKDENGEEYSDWEEKKLGDVGKIITGKTPSTTDSNLWNGDIQFITPTDIKDGIKYQESTERYVVNNDKIKILPSNSIIYTCIASIGKMCISKFPSITNQQINSLVVYKDYNFEFVYYWLFYITPYIKTTQANTTLPIINKTDFSKFSILIPCLKEQQIIAHFLSNIDVKIETVTGEIGKMQLFKKGLLQQMFV